MSLQRPTSAPVEPSLQHAASLLRAAGLSASYALGGEGRVHVFSSEGKGRECVVMEETVPGGPRAALDGIRHLTILVRMSCPESRGHPVNWHEQCHRLAAEALRGAAFEGALRACRQTRYAQAPFASGGRLHSVAAYQVDLAPV